MRNLSKPTKILIIVLLFAIVYGPIYWCWKVILPSYSGLLAPVANQIANAFEFSGSHYSLTYKKGKFRIVAFRQSGGRFGTQNLTKQEGARSADDVSYNLVLWLALSLATFPFTGQEARRRFLMWGAILLIMFHLCDLFILAKNANCRLLRGIHDSNPGRVIVSYSFAWQWLWWWASDLNQMIIRPFLPLGLWIVFCSESFKEKLARKSKIQVEGFREIKEAGIK